jgi:hypothetical protein
MLQECCIHQQLWQVLDGPLLRRTLLSLEFFFLVADLTPSLLTLTQTSPVQWIS